MSCRGLPRWGADAAEPVRASRLQELVAAVNSGQEQAAASFETYRSALHRYTEATRTPTQVLAPELPRAVVNTEVFGCLAVVPFCGGRSGAAWHTHFRTAPLASQTALAPFGVTIDRAGSSEVFQSVEAAFHAMRWWGNPRARAEFSAAATGEQCAALCERYRKLERSGDVCSEFKNEEEEAEALLSAVRARCSLPGQDKLLLATRGSLLLCHPSPGSCSAHSGSSDAWADPLRSTVPHGSHWLRHSNAFGRALMIVRDELCASFGLPPSWPQGLTASRWELTVAACRSHCDSAVDPKCSSVSCPGSARTPSSGGA